MPHTGSHPIPRADWLAARALLASRRLRPFVPVWLGAFALVFAAVYIVRGPFTNRSAAALLVAGRAQLATRDTTPMVHGLRMAQDRLAREDSTVRVMLENAEAREGRPALSPKAQRTRDSLRAMVTQLDAALDRAAKAPLPASYRALAQTHALAMIGRAQTLVDTLDLLERTRQALDPVAAPQREFAQLSERANAIGSTLQGIGQSRRVALTQQITALESGETDGRPMEKRALEAISSARTRRDSARMDVARAESALRDARQWHTEVQERAGATARARAARLLGTSPVAAALSAMVMMAVLTFTLAVVAEVRAPTIAHAREAERLTGLPVLASVEPFRIPPEGRARLQPGTGVDPFRMVYLALTVSGTRERAVCVAGDHPPTVAAVAGRLAVSAAADERATLLVDLAPGIAASSTYFGWRDEPGFTEAVAGVRLWREVARPIGASEGMAVDVIPAGAPRQDTEASVQNATAREEFSAFNAEYDFLVLVAPTAAAARIAADVCTRPPTIIVARMARTRLRALRELAQKLSAVGASVHGVILVSA